MSSLVPSIIVLGNEVVIRVSVDLRLFLGLEDLADLRHHWGLLIPSEPVLLSLQLALLHLLPELVLVELGDDASDAFLVFEVVVLAFCSLLSHFLLVNFILDLLLDLGQQHQTMVLVIILLHLDLRVAQAVEIPLFFERERVRLQQQLVIPIQRLFLVQTGREHAVHDVGNFLANSIFLSHL